MPSAPNHKLLTAIVPEKWVLRLNEARSADEVVKLAAEYVASWDEADTSRLPAGCNPPPIRSARDVTEYALLLTQVQLEWAGSLARGVLLDRMTLFFTYCSTRIAHLTFIAGVGFAARSKVPKIGA
jgi:hypothetical protein